MRHGLACGALFALFIFLIPLLALGGTPAAVQFLATQSANSAPTPQSAMTPDTPEAPAETPEQVPAAPPESASAPVLAETDDGYRMLDQSSGKVLTVSARDYTRGALAAEMPPTFHPEALKAQAVAAHTYALYVKRETRQNDAQVTSDFTVDPKNWKSYVTEALFRERYGALADAYWQSICAAADEVCGYAVTYEDEPIVAAYHSMSGGVTEDASNVWTGGKPYLVPVESRGDTLAPDYATSQTFTSEQVATALRTLLPKVKLDDAAPADWITIAARSEGGYATEIAVADETIRGVDLRGALDLRSANFEVTYSGGTFTFAVKGYGHGVGFSQYGADYMARQGATFDEILLHYYAGATLSPLGVGK